MAYRIESNPMDNVRLIQLGDSCHSESHSIEKASIDTLDPWTGVWQSLHLKAELQRS